MGQPSAAGAELDGRAQLWWQFPDNAPGGHINSTGFQFHFGFIDRGVLACYVQSKTTINGPTINLCGYASE
jgi:hypothetical protein